jgi:hypothetical protein
MKAMQHRPLLPRPAQATDAPPLPPVPGALAQGLTAAQAALPSAGARVIDMLQTIHHVGARAGRGVAT